MNKSDTVFGSAGSPPESPKSPQSSYEIKDTLYSRNVAPPKAQAATGDKELAEKLAVAEKELEVYKTIAAKAKDEIKELEDDIASKNEKLNSGHT